MFKPKTSVKNPRALLYKRFIGIEKSSSLARVYKTYIDDKYWQFDYENLLFIQVESSLVTNSEIITITDHNTILLFMGNYFRYLAGDWEKLSSLPESYTLLSASFNNIAKYQTNKYYYVGSFDYMISGSQEDTEVQYLKGNIIPLRTFNIKHFNDYVNLCEGDLVVINNRLYSVESPETVQKRLPKPYNVYFATLNSIL